MNILFFYYTDEAENNANINFIYIIEFKNPNLVKIKGYNEISWMYDNELIVFVDKFN